MENKEKTIKEMAEAFKRMVDEKEKIINDAAGQLIFSLLLEIQEVVPYARKAEGHKYCIYLPKKGCEDKEQDLENGCFISPHILAPAKNVAFKVVRKDKITGEAVENIMNKKAIAEYIIWKYL